MEALLPHMTSERCDEQFPQGTGKHDEVYSRPSLPRKLDISDYAQFPLYLRFSPCCAPNFLTSDRGIRLWGTRLHWIEISQNYMGHSEVNRKILDTSDRSGVKGGHFPYTSNPSEVTTSNTSIPLIHLYLGSKNPATWILRYIGLIFMVLSTIASSSRNAAFDGFSIAIIMILLIQMLPNAYNWSKSFVMHCFWKWNCNKATIHNMLLWFVSHSMTRLPYQLEHTDLSFILNTSGWFDYYPTITIAQALNTLPHEISNDQGIGTLFNMSFYFHGGILMC